MNQNHASTDDLTHILRNMQRGDRQAEQHLISLVYAQFHALAVRIMRYERPGHTLQPTALVNEAYLRLIADRETDWQSRAHFFAVAATVMRHVLTDYARQRRAARRGGGARHTTLDIKVIVSSDRFEDLLVLEDALQRLEAHDPRAAQVVVARFYGGLNHDEIARVMNRSSRSVKRDWDYGRTWLKAELTSGRTHAAGKPQSP